jgi:hypothetical protein
MVERSNTLNFQEHMHERKHKSKKDKAKAGKDLNTSEAGTARSEHSHREH